MYEPYEEIVARSELIVTGTIIEMQFKEEKTDVYTVYKLKIKEIIKGKSDSVEIEIKAVGGCFETGICVTSGMSYDFEEGNQVFMMLKRDPESNKLQSVRSASTVSFVSDEGDLYADVDELAYILNRKNKRKVGEKPTTISQVKLIVKNQDN